MKLTTLQGLFQQKYPTGSIAFAKSAYKVRFRPGRAYQYRSSSHYALAERLELIPDIDIVAYSQSILRQLVNGADSVVGPSGCGDTLRFTHSQQGGEGRIEENLHADCDQYGRSQSVYSLTLGPNPWVI